MLSPLHQAIGANLGSRTAAWLYDQLTTACVRPPGMGHLEDPRLTTDLTMARDFDLGISGPPLSISMDFIASGLVEMTGGAAAALVLTAYSWWAPLLLAGAWLGTHWFLRESAVWRDRNTDEVREAQRHADYAYRLSVDPPAAKELRLFGLGAWMVERFTSRRRRLLDLQWQATRLRERPMLWSLLLVLSANVVVLGSIATAAAAGRVALAQAVTYASAAVATSMIAFGGLSWALDGAAAPASAVLRLRDAMGPAGELTTGTRAAKNLPVREIRFRNVRFAYPTTGQPVLEDFDLTMPAGSSLAIVGQNGAGKTTLAKLLCRLYDPQAGAIEIDGIDLREFDLDAWRSRLAAVFQDFIRLELPLRDNVAPSGAPDETIRSVVALVGENGAGKSTLVKLLCRMYPPDQGRILVDDLDLARVNTDEWRSHLAGAFQDFFRFEFRARHTVGVGDVPRLDDERAVVTAICRAGADDIVERLVGRLETQLGATWPGGVEVSFGQWQKLALARGFMRDRPLVLVLDEPTAALDAETEHTLFERYAAAARGDGRITILVSHRFSTVRVADRIVVLDGAHLAEVGTHDELMAKRGQYAELYGIQAAAYRDIKTKTSIQTEFGASGWRCL